MLVRAMVLAFCGVPLGFAANAGDPDIPGPVSSVAVDPLKVDGLREVVPGLIQIIHQVGKGDAQYAAELVQHRWYRTFIKQDGLFGEDEREELIRAFQMSFDDSREFETVEILGATKASSMAYRIWCIAHGDFGPALFEWHVYYYDGRWQTLALLYDTEWDRLVNVADRLSSVPAVTYRSASGNDLCRYQFSREAEPEEQSGFPVSEAEQFVRRIASAIEKIGKEDSEAAISILISARPPRKQLELESSRSKLSAILGRIKSAQYDTVELIAARKISAGAFRLYLAANGASGAHLYRCDAYRYRGRWYFHERLTVFSGLEGFEKMEMLSGIAPIEKPLVIELESEAQVVDHLLETGRR